MPPKKTEAPPAPEHKGPGPDEVPAGESPPENRQDTSIPGPSGSYDPRKPPKGLPESNVTGIVDPAEGDIDRDGNFDPRAINPPAKGDRRT